MTDRQPHSEPDPKRSLSSAVGPAGAQGSPTPTGAVVDQPSPLGPDDTALAHEAGVELKARSQWAYARMRFFRHRLAVVSLIVLILIGLVALFAEQVAPYGYDEIPLDDADFIQQIGQSPTTEDHHYFGTDQLGRDYFSRVIFGVRTWAQWRATTEVGSTTS
jgi:hypothetical protein